MSLSKIFLIVVIIFLGSFVVSGALFYAIDPMGFREKPKEVTAVENLAPTFVPENLHWINAVPNAPWESRDSGEVFLFQNKIWLMGGLNGNAKVGENHFVEYWTAPHFNDIWNTEDGINWTQIATSSAWEPRRSMSVVFFNNKLWMFGGWSPITGYTNDIWTSDDGIHWTQIVKNANWPAREGQLVEVFQNKIWLIGGVNYDERQTKNDVWYSENGTDWVQVENIPWKPRWDHAISVFNGKLFLTGGMNLADETFRDVWATEDGINWTLVTDNPAWQARQGHALESYKGKLWIIGRLNDEESGGVNDVWYSDDGFVWNKTINNPTWTGREDFFSAIFRDKIWVFGGMDANWQWKNDVWASEFSETLQSDAFEYDKDEIDSRSKEIEPALVRLVPAPIIFEDGKKVAFQLADGFNIAVAAEGLGKARFMAKSPDGKMFVPDMVNMNLSREGKIYILENFDETAKRFQTKSVYLSGLRGPNSIAFYTDKNGKDWIYIALTEHLIRYPYSAGDIKPSTAPEIITTFPNQQVPGETSIVWHITRTIKFYDDRLYVSVGSGCNACEQPEGEMRAMIYSINPDGSDKQIYADGLRNAVGFTQADGELYVTTNGADHLGDNMPDDVMYRLINGKHYGWPYCYESNKKIDPDTSKKWTRPFACEDAPLSFATFGPHSAPLGIEYFSRKAHPLLKNAFLVALHGSFDPKIGAGYHIVKVSMDGEQEIFMDGFLIEKEEQAGWFANIAYAHSDTDEPAGNSERIGRPVDILQNDANSFFFTDDYKGRIYYVYASNYD